MKDMGVHIGGGRENRVPLMKDLKSKLKNQRFDPQEQMKKELEATFEQLERIQKQQTSGTMMD